MQVEFGFLIDDGLTSHLDAGIENLKKLNANICNFYTESGIEMQHFIK
jgi:hypothetical protein